MNTSLRVDIFPLFNYHFVEATTNNGTKLKNAFELISTCIVHSQAQKLCIISLSPLGLLLFMNLQRKLINTQQLLSYTRGCTQNGRK